MRKSFAVALVAIAIGVAVVVGYLSFGRTPPPSSTVVPLNRDAVAAPDGAEVAPVNP